MSNFPWNQDMDIQLLIGNFLQVSFYVCLFTKFGKYEATTKNEEKNNHIQSTKTEIIMDNIL